MPALVGAVGHVVTEPRDGVSLSGVEESRVPTGPITCYEGADSAIALTFDDGPDPRFTPQVLDILAEHDATATFFVTGEAAESHMWLVTRMLAEGHEVANHTYSHPFVEHLDRAAVEDEMDDCLLVLGVLGCEPRWYRPPRKGHTGVQAELAAERGMGVALWTRTMERSRFSSADEVTEVLLSETTPGEIILAHDGGANRWMTMAALPGYLNGLDQRGIEVTTLSGLSALSEKP